MGGTGNEAKAAEKTQGLCNIRLVEMLEQSLVMKLAVRSKHLATTSSIVYVPSVSVRW